MNTPLVPLNRTFECAPLQNSVGVMRTLLSARWFDLESSREFASVFDSMFVSSRAGYSITSRRLAAPMDCSTLRRHINKHGESQLHELIDLAALAEILESTKSLSMGLHTDDPSLWNVCYVTLPLQQRNGHVSTPVAFNARQVCGITKWRFTVGVPPELHGVWPDGTHVVVAVND